MDVTETPCDLFDPEAPTAAQAATVTHGQQGAETFPESQTDSAAQAANIQETDEAAAPAVAVEDRPAAPLAAVEGGLDAAVAAEDRPTAPLAVPADRDVATIASGSLPPGSELDPNTSRDPIEGADGPPEPSETARKMESEHADSGRGTDPTDQGAPTLPSDGEPPTPARGLDVRGLLPEADGPIAGPPRVPVDDLEKESIALSEPAPELDVEFRTLPPQYAELASGFDLEFQSIAGILLDTDPVSSSERGEVPPLLETGFEPGLSELVQATEPVDSDVQASEDDQPPEPTQPSREHRAVAPGEPLRSTPPPKPGKDPASDLHSPPVEPNLALERGPASFLATLPDPEPPPTGEADAPGDKWPIFSDVLVEPAATPHSPEFVVPAPTITEAPPSAAPGFAPATSIPALAHPGDAELPAATRRRSKVSAVLWVTSLIMAFFVGAALKSLLSPELFSADATPVGQPIGSVATAGQSDPTAPGDGDPAKALTTRPMSEIARLPPSERTKLEAVALGRHWSAQKISELEELGKNLRREPKRLGDAKVRARLFEFVADRATSRAALELLADLDQPLGLDMLYKIWTGSRDRTETTQLAEALLLAKDVRPRVSPALDIALALREKPTSCRAIRRLAERATREADRRSVMLLVATGARQNCGDQPRGECLRCFDDAKDLRRAVQEAAARPDPIP